MNSVQVLLKDDLDILRKQINILFENIEGKGLKPLKQLESVLNKNQVLKARQLVLKGPLKFKKCYVSLHTPRDHHVVVRVEVDADASSAYKNDFSLKFFSIERASKCLKEGALAALSLNAMKNLVALTQRKINGILEEMGEADASSRRRGRKRKNLSE